MNMQAEQAMVSLRISIAMCTYNATRHLSEQLQSIAQQQRLPDELVVCDDASSDGTVASLERFARQVPFPVRIVRNPLNLGYSRNFVQALELCTGDIIALSDQDDRWEKHKVERLFEIFTAEPETRGVFSNGSLMDEFSRPIPGTLWSSFAFSSADLRRVEQRDAVPVLLQRNVVTGMTMAIRRDARDLMASMPDHWPHDSWLALLLAANGGLRACPELLVSYRVHDNQQIGVPITRTEKLRFLFQRGLSAYLKLSRERNLRDYSKEAVQFEALVAAAQNNPELGRAWWLPLAEAKAQHARRGVDLLGKGRLRRLPSMLRHRKEYRRYSPTGAPAFWRDLMI